MTASAQSTSTVEGAAWGASASGWVEYWAGFAAPARKAVARAAEIEAGAAVLDAGCGSAEFCELAAARGARERHRRGPGDGRSARASPRLVRSRDRFHC